jgi:nucleolar protein 14
MEEIIAKSKMYKAQKAREREEEEAQLAALDTAFTALVKGPGLGALVKPAGYDK